MLFTHFDNRQHMKFLNNSIFYANETQRNRVSQSLLVLARDFSLARLVFVFVVLAATNCVEIRNGKLLFWCFLTMNETELRISSRGSI